MKTLLLALIVIALAFVAAEPAAAQTWSYGTPVTYYYAPSVGYSPTVSYYPAPTTTYYHPGTIVAPVTTYYAPALPVYAPVTTYYSPGVIGSTIYGTPQLYRPGQPVRNVLRSIVP